MTHSLVLTKKQIGLAAAYALAAALAATTVGCSKKESVATPAVSEKVYTVTPASVKVTAGIVTGELTEMKVTERVEEGTGRIVNPAKLTGKLVLKNISANQAVRLIAGKIQYIDVQGQPIPFKGDRTAPTLSISSSYNASDRLDPGKDVTQTVDADFPAEALKANKLKEIQLGLSYIPSPFVEEKLDFAVSIGAQ
jgi:hypothetical protein